MLDKAYGVGERAPQVDGPAKITGQAKFAGDIKLAGMLEAKVLRSPFAHARIRSIDVSRAEALPGVACILTGNDLGDIDPYYGHAVRDRPIVAIDRAKFAGDPVAIVAAESASIADQALELIVVDYEELPHATTIEEAMVANAPQIHDTEQLRLGLFHGLGDFQPHNNICYEHHLEDGDVEKLFSKADEIVEGEYRFPSVYQYSMEPHLTVAHWIANDQLELWSNCQHPYLVRAEVADIFSLSKANVRIHVPYLGGGFGSKSYTRLEPMAAAVARKAARPVRIANSVTESMWTSRRHNMICKMQTAADKDGMLLARKVELWLDTGAYADNGPRVVATAADAAAGPYAWQAQKVDAFGVYTNRPPSGSYRAFGATHLQWIGESQINEIGRRVGLDALEMRKKNLLKFGDTIRKGGKPLDADLIGDIQKVADGLDWGEKRGENIGRGFGIGLLAAGSRPVSTSFLRLEADGTITVLVSTTELGQGARTAMSQLVSEVLKVPLSQIRVPDGDTQITPYDRSTGASRSTTLAGGAVHLAALDLREQLIDIAVKMWKLSDEAIEIREGQVWGGDKSATFAECLEWHFGFVGGELFGRGIVRPEEGQGTYSAGPVFWEVCTGGVEIELDRDTGEIKLRKVVSVADVGTAVNPSLIKGQEMGGAAQGLGNAIFEEMHFEDGQLMNGNLADYRVPKLFDMAEEFVSVIVQNEDGPGPYGLKGVGEGILAAMPAAIVNALGELGIEINELPATPERVWKAMNDSRQDDNTLQKKIGGE
ncbi:MAG: xanthine dehydrogenase family protein molybdopterin-binding subunit [Chloroflexi bacterium]|nr:MAG: xanthine dehydrogenase family protein molybdopterin-binding subunit [Chloroflexota bacterium]MBL1195051.1 xanthine dehydrogenase family protein molybdopterin-binding subunit [Chloroflexota bacterium]NOH12339.1 xanthine dehydrogenase family protein molybdopterin-binding subunit [Chloroflexota bacterium]